jgi:hypothetical protein
MLKGSGMEVLYREPGALTVIALVMVSLRA